MFITPDLLERLRNNGRIDPAAAAVAARIVEAAAPWRARSDDDLWGLMYGPSLFRSWDVWSTGHCPTCKGDNPLYAWKMDALARPWKTTCPHCGDIFPKNDFEAYHRSGLDGAGLFQKERADRALLFNVEHPGPADPLRGYGVDDGWGYTDGENRWFFVAAYLIYGQWRQLVYSGIMNLAAAYAVTGDRVCARKALVLLDRVADLYPSFDFMTQAVIEERFYGHGYVTVWHDAAPETKQLALAFACVRDALEGDAGLAAFLAGKAARHGLGNPKRTAADIRRNIEDGLLLDPLRNVHKITSNYPSGEVTQMVLHGVLGGPEHERALQDILGAVLERATAYDGITGEKGLPSYSAYTIQTLADFLAMLERVRPGSLAACMRRCPALRQTYRFHLDTWCQQLYYPQVGDALWFGSRAGYCGFPLRRLVPDVGQGGLTALLAPSMFDFAWRLYEATGDAGYVQLLHHANGRSLEGLPHDLFAADPGSFRDRVAAAIAEHGPDLRQGNVLKRQWCLGLLRSGHGECERTLWISFDSGGSHSHANGLNIGLFARGIDWMPDFGYPPLQFSHNDGPHSNWYLSTAAHNTVVVDGASHAGRRSRVPIRGRCTLWGDGRAIAAVRTAAEELFLDHLLAEPAALYGAGRDRVGLYAFRPACFARVRVYTRPADGSGDWTLQFADDFQRAELGPDWRSPDGAWTVRDGAVCGAGELVCTRSFPGRQRLEYEAWTGEPEPCDLSAFLAGTDRGNIEGVFFGFGSGMNEGSKLVIYTREAMRAAARIEVGRRHHLLCECDGDALRLCVDGHEALRFDHTPDAVRRRFEDARRRLQFERTLVRLDLSDADSYYADIFRVAGGRDHAKFTHGTYARLETRGLAPVAAADFGHGALLRGSRTDPAPAPGWSADWKAASWRDFIAVKDPRDVRPDDMAVEPPAGSDLRMRVTELTEGAEATVCEAWVAGGNYSSKVEAWIPCVIARRRAGEAPLASTFVSTIEVFDGSAPVRRVRRLPLVTRAGAPCGDDHVALEVELADGRRDLIVALNPSDPLGRPPEADVLAGVRQPDWGLELEGELAVVRRSADGRIASAALGRARRLSLAGLDVRLREGTEWIELLVDEGGPRAISGDAAAVLEARCR